MRRSRSFLLGFLATAAVLAVIGLARSCGEDQSTASEATTAPPLPSSPPAIAVIIDGYTAYVPPGPKRLPNVPENLVDAVRRGTELVSSLRLDKKQCVVPEGKIQIGWKRCLGDYLVAAVDETDQLQVVEVYGGTSTAPDGFTVTCEREGACDGGVNPPFIISAPPGWTAVAVRTAVPGDGPDGIDGATYVPYSTRLNDPELRQAGLEYLHDAVLAAHYELRAKDVRSQFIRGRYVTDFGTPDHIITLILTEQMLSDVAFEAGTEMERLEMLDRALVTLGLNRWRSFSYTRSWADARGIGQIVGSPYRAIREQYPRAELPEDDIRGRIDHHASVKAMIAHTDAEWWTFMGEAETDHRAHLLADERSRRLVFAAGYNANVGLTVHTAIHECGERWRDESCTQLPRETRLYLVKYEWIYRVLFDPKFRTKVEEGVWPTVYEADQVAIAVYKQRKAASAAASTTE